MKLSEETVTILKNFSTINKAIEVKPGNAIATISPAKTVLAKAKVTENFETGFAIYELNKFLGALSLFNNPELTFHEKYVVISENNQKIRYTFCDPSTIVVPPSKDINLPDVKINFTLDAAVIQSLNKSVGVLGLPEIAIYADGEFVYIAAANSKNPSADEFSIKLAESSETFKFFFNKEYFKILERDYDVSLSSQALVELVSGDLKYFIMGESK